MDDEMQWQPPASPSQTRQQVVDDPTLVRLICENRWKEAWEVVRRSPLAPYMATIDHEGQVTRLPLHELCRMVANEEEISSEEDRDINREIYNLARFLILISQSNVDSPLLDPEAMQEDETPRLERYRTCLFSLRAQHGYTPLHVLCANSADPSMMDIIFQSCPTRALPGYGDYALTAVDLLKLQNEINCTPLHFASESEFPFSSLQLMLDRCPNNDDVSSDDPRLIPDKDGDLPAHWAFASNASPRRLRALLSGRPESLLYANDDGNLPMDEYVDNHCDDWDFLDIDEKWALWMSMQEILKVVTGWQDEDESTWSPLHAIASGVHFVPVTFWNIAVEYCQVGTYDSNGLLPLHVAVATTKPVEYFGRSRSRDVERRLMEEIILSSVDLAERPTSQGRLALHLAAEARQPEWILRALRDAYPDALTTLDPTTGFPPLLLAATDENNNVEVVFYLLRTYPSTLQTWA